ncbi:MAG: DUF882 domain-containing protein [Pseudomonadota bacterium]
MSRNESTTQLVSRRLFLAGAGAAAAQVGVAAPALAKGAGHFRSISLVNKRTAEKLNTVYWVEGQYIPEALEAVNYIMRDWRQGLVMRIDPRTIDIMAATHNLLDCSEPFEIISGYRSARTNAMLRRRSRGVARKSYHMKGMACDLTLQTRSVWQVSSAAKSLGAGGVGRYRRSNFTHVDSGPVRDWGR